MEYIPFTLDGDVQAGIVVVCVILGVASIVSARRKSLPPSRLKRRVGIAVGCACAGIVLYNLYILQRQTVEKATHRTFGDAVQARPTR
jgi:hypothetical protein